MSDQKLEFTTADVAWLTSLARTLTGNWPDADDLAQETWVAARTSPPKDGVPRRPWLAKVLRHFHLRKLRARARRNCREQAVSRPEAVASTDELLERAELQKKLAESLIGSEEPYRTSLILVVFEGFTTADLAEHQGISEVNARRRVRKGRELLRAKLQHDHGHDWRYWAALMLPIARLPLPGETVPATPAVVPQPRSTSGGSWSGGMTAVAAAASVVLSVLVPGLLGSTPQPVVLAPADGLAQALAGPANDSLAFADVGPRGGRRPMTQSLDSPATAMFGGRANTLEPASPAHRVSGRVRVRDEFGAVHWPSSGQLRLETATGQSVVAVSNGTFELDLPNGERRIIVRNAWLDERAALFERELQIGPKTSAIELDLEATWLPSTLLHVVDSVSGKPLSDLTVVADESPRASHGRVFPHPGSFEPEAVLADGASSPVALHPRTSYQDVYLVSAPGYRWAAFRADHVRGGERTLALERGVADLTLHFEGASNGHARLRAVRPGVTPLDFGPLFGTSVTLKQLAPGPLGLEVVVACGERFAQNVVLTEGANDLWLDLTPTKSNEAAPARTLTGSIRAAEGWFDDGLVLRVVGAHEHRLPRSEWKPIEGQPGVWSFELPGLENPSALVEVLPTGWSTELSLAADSKTALEIELPEPIERSIRLTDAETGALLGDDQPRLEVRWKPVARSIDSHTNSAAYVPAHECWRIASIDIPIEVVVSATGYVTQTLQLPRGASGEQHMRLQRASGLVLELHDGRDEVPVDVDWIKALGVTDLDGGGGAICARAFDGVEIVFWVSQPGEFRLELPAIEGFVPPELPVLTLVPGEIVRVPIAFERSPGAR